MRIGVFGDSFADKHFDDTWWAFLKNYGHDVHCFGESGSSLAFSAGLLWTHALEFEHLIWCVTNVNRVSFRNQDKNYHVTNSFDAIDEDINIAKKQQISQAYLQHVHDSHGHEALGWLAVQGALQKFQNLTVIPCFETPVYFMQEPGFNLCELSAREAQYYFPGKDLYTIHQQYYDFRSAHFMPSTHLKLAEMINTAVMSGKKIFSADYSSFPPPTDSVEHRFPPR